MDTNTVAVPPSLPGPNGPASGPSADRDNPLRRSREIVAHIRKSEVFASYEAAFEKATGLPLAIRAVGAFDSPLLESKAASPFLVLLSRTNRTCAAYLQFQQEVEQAAAAAAATRESFAGLVESMVPVRMGDTVVAYLQTGQVLLQPPSRAAFRKLARQWAEQGLELPLAELESAHRGTPVVPKARYAAMLSLLSIFAQHLSSLVNQLMIVRAKAELPAVARARSFIEQHQAEEISLGEVARAVNMSAFYFCKVFRKVTGVTFVEYLARRRVEEVKKLLLDPHKRISEAAFEAGFQSLSQFNRVFRRLAGEAPTVYKEKLHGGHASGARSLVSAA
jgi:AraC-like DNA-binding protein